MTTTEENKDRTSATDVIENQNSENESKITSEEVTNSTENLSKEQVLTQELEEYKDKYLRLYSEFDNFRKRSSRERIDLINTASFEVIKDILPVLDDFERALQSFENIELEAKFQDGFKLIHSKLSSILSSKGLKAMENTDDFNPDLQECIAQIPSPQDSQKGKIIETIEKGYYLHEKIIRYAKVIIGQ